jgi:signal transduction histidine kinase
MLIKSSDRATQRQRRADHRIAMMGEFTASIAHEINQPLMAMVTNADTCLRWLAGDRPNIKEARRAAERIVRDGHRAGDIVESMRALVRNGAPETEAIDVNTAIKNTLALVHGDLRRHDVATHTVLAAGLPPVMADGTQLQQVIVNLIRNGIEAMAAVPGRSGQLTISTGCDARGDVAVAVSDTGSGIDPAMSELIFEAFFTTKPNGVGLGLAVCRTIVKAHGGRLWAYPNRPRGSVLHFTLPAAAGRQDDVQEFSETTRSGGSPDSSRPAHAGGVPCLLSTC